MREADDKDLVARYSMRIEWSNEDAAYVVTVPELPGCMTHGATYAEVVRQGEDAFATWLATARAWSDPVPAPRVVRRRSRSAG